MSLGMFSIQERFLIKSGLWWRSYGTSIPGYSIVPFQRVSSYAIQVAMCAW
jgi:hypothetical protein